MPPLLLSKKFEDKNVERFANRLARRSFGNSIRAFSYYGYAPQTWGDHKVDPFLRKDGGLYDLDKRNPEHLEMLKRRISYFTDRQLTVVLSIHDNCSLYPFIPGHWNMSWWNGLNNINGTSPLRKAIVHAYEPEWQDDPEFQQTWHYVTGYTDYIISELEPEFGNYIIFEPMNEPHTGIGWHDIQQKILRKYGVPICKNL